MSDISNGDVRELEMRIRLTQNIWTTLEEEMIPLRDLSDEHLANIIAFCEEGNSPWGIPPDEWEPKLEKEIQRRGSEYSTDANACICFGDNGNPLNQCDECPR